MSLRTRIAAAAGLAVALVVLVAAAAIYFGVRAEMPPYGSPDLVALELYLAARARGLAISVPGVRK